MPLAGKRTLATFLVSMFAIATAIVAARAQSPAAAPQSSAPGSVKLAEQQFKNIKVLKGIPADQVIPAMEFITASLGVECEFCHVRQDHGMAFDKDDKKPKEVARKMIEMMTAINKENFEGKREVTCNTCHHGAAHPAGIPLVAVEGEKPPMMEHDKKADASLPSADDVFAKYLSAAGGAAAIQKITSRVEKGTISGFGDQKIGIDVFAKAPDKRSSTMHMTGGESTTAYDGKQGWLSFPGRPVHMMNAAESAGARIDADFALAVNAKSLRDKWKPAAGEAIDGKQTNLLIGQTEGQPPLRLYFDAQTGLLVRLIRYVETPLGRLPTQVDYADYRDADGIKVPYQWSISRPGNRFTIQVERFQQNVPVDDSKFVPPPPPPPGQAPPAHP